MPGNTAFQTFGPTCFQNDARSGKVDHDAAIEQIDNLQTVIQTMTRSVVGGVVRQFLRLLV